MLDAVRLTNAVRDVQAAFILESNFKVAFRSLLDELLIITESEYGFIGELERDPDPRLRVFAYSDISWDEATRELLVKNAATGLVFDKLQTLFGHAISTEDVVIANDAANDPRAGGLPKGHPPLRSFLGLPFHFGGEMTGLIGLANRPLGYDESLVEFLTPLVATCGVISHARKVADERRQSVEIIQQANQTQRLIEFSQRLAHDLNNLLTVIQSTLDAHMEPDPHPMSAASLGLLRGSTEQASELAKKILSFSGSTVINRRPTDLRQLLHQAVEFATTLAPASTEISAQVENNLPFIQADGPLLQQVFLNLFLNSVDALGDAGGTVKCSVAAKDNMVCVEIIDDGPGMPPDVRERAFDPYFSTKGTERGFGLASVMGLLNAHGAQFFLDSEPGCGTSFSILLPTVDTVSSGRDGDDYQMDGKRVLLVDDDGVVSKAIEMLLNRQGASVRCAGDGCQAIELIESGEEFDLLLMDVSMPEMDGVDTWTHLRRGLNVKTPTILMSGHTNRFIPDEWLDEAITLLRKPFRWEELVEACVLVESRRRD